MNNTWDLNSFWSYDTPYVPFPIFSFGHLVSLGMILLIIVLMFVFRDKIKLQKNKNIIGNSVASILMIQFIFLYVWFFSSGTFSLIDSLPVYLCRLTILLCIFMLYRKSYFLFEVLYFWGLLGAPLALMTPDTAGHLFPHWMYIRYFIGHGGILVSVFFMMIAYDYKPTFNSLKKTIKISFVYLFFTFIINILVGGNYSYLMGKPYSATILDVMPDYPYYLPIMILSVLLIFLVLYLPFSKKLKSVSRKDN